MSERTQGGESAQGSAARFGGTLERGLAGDYRIAIGATLAEAWRLTRGFKRACLTGLVVLFLALSVIWLAIAVIARQFGGSLLESEALVGLVIELLFVAAVYPLLIGPVMMGVRRAVGLPTPAKMAFGYMNVAVRVIVASLAIALVTFLTTIVFVVPGLYLDAGSLLGTVLSLLSVLPGVYLTVGYALVVPLIADRKLGPWPAMEVSRRAITKHWFAVAGVLVAASLIVGSSALPPALGAAIALPTLGVDAAIVVAIVLGAGLVWTVPMAIVVVGVLYRDVFGVTERS